MIDRDILARDVQLACLWEACAEKAGNVNRRHDFRDTTLPDFLASAAVVAPVLARADEQGVGATVLESVRRTRQVSAGNTNLGIVLLLAPLCAARARGDLRQHLPAVLSGLGVPDSQAVYTAIRAARPGGLGTVSEGDLTEEPTRPLTELMQLAADRDRIARQYATAFAEVLGEVADDLSEAIDRAGLEGGIRLAQLRQLARHGDSLIARKRGEAESREAATRAATVLSGGDWQEFDHWLRAAGNARNPGTTADLLAAGLFVLLSQGRIPSRPPHWGLPASPVSDD